MKKVLIYGDSNTWGDNFISGKRIPDEKQWVNILKKEYGDKYLFLQEGLPGRLAGNDEKDKKFKNGKSNFISTYRTNGPIDILIISLGTNDLQIKYNKSSKKIINDLNWYRKVLEESFSDLDDRKKYFNNKMPRIIYILPINFDYKVNANMIFDEDSEKKRIDIINNFKDKKDIISSNNLDLFDDGIHLSYKGHKQMSKLVRELLDD